MLILVLTWTSGRLIHFWGPRQGARRFLTAYLSIIVAVYAVGAFLIMRQGGSFTTGSVVPSLAQIAWLGSLILASRRWPRAAGWLLLATAVAVLPTLIRTVGYGMGTPTWIGAIELAALVLVPLLTPALVLIFADHNG
jgi:hypothetical protein